MTRHALIALLGFALSLGCAAASNDDGDGDTETGSEGQSTDSNGTTESTGSSETSSTDSGSSDSGSTDSGSTDSGSSDSGSTGSGSTGSGSTDSGSDSTDTNGTTDSGSDTGEGVMCPDVFPSFDKGCGADSDCAVVVHTTDCCGNSVAWGINQAEVDAFEAAEAICDSQYPQCDCAAWPTVAEDGNSAEDPTLFAASCQQGACSSYVPMP